eukprot:CAMPEP_0177743796 /NCGR_PEP_ID=MMETSP0484_2-20121128/29385_1 /TAXON_ID=354590 /ORGANISM="Rhodomonas lens, Strain RHODO" /LENGTH=107 /DNA_ID=CAMNT_0019258219 /DNA_START=163 /DNA_END=486 /DNA_ORIENTATION=+
MSAASEDVPSPGQADEDARQFFLEEASRRGAKKIAALSVEERVKRAMMAEEAEDRMSLMYDELEGLLGENGMPKRVEDREKVEVLARQIKEARQLYLSLVTGEDMKK